jgi:DNA-binding HxlR family transcriptional regulator
VHSYGQYCALAKALDVVGSRWTLLIVRELLIRGPSRYTDLRNGLPGIATNMLADRLRELEADGIVESEVAPAPIATTLFRLTPRGAELEPILLQLGRWGAPLLASAPRRDSFRAHWLALPVKLHLKDNGPDRSPLSIEVRAGDESVSINAADGALQVIAGGARNPALVLTGSPQSVLGLLFGKLDWPAARAAGLTHEGDPKVLIRIRPREPDQLPL